MGLLSPKQLASARAYNRKHFDLPADLDVLAQLAAAFQDSDKKLSIDGQVGPKTRKAIAAALASAAADAALPAPPDVVTDHGGPYRSAAPVVDRIVWPPFDGPLERRPRTRSEAFKIFGNPGKGAEAEPSWERRYIVELHGDDAIPEIPARFYFKTNRHAEPYVREGFRRGAIACPSFKVTRAASYVFRRMRHDTPERAEAEGREIYPISDHGLGIAVDINSPENRAVYFGVDEDGPEPWTPEWWAIWPDSLPQAYVEAWESVGWLWGGRWPAAPGKRGYRDPMHFTLRGGAIFQL
jgi:hypothetical protein